MLAAFGYWNPTGSYSLQARRVGMSFACPEGADSYHSPAPCVTPEIAEQVLSQEDHIRKLAERYADAEDAFFIGRGYMWMCTVLVSLACIYCWWSAGKRQAADPKMVERTLWASYGRYVFEEHPDRGPLFAQVAESLGQYALLWKVRVDELRRYLGDPDQREKGTSRGEYLIYVYKPSDATAPRDLLFCVKDGFVVEFGVGK